jgi:hypothetical protein
MVPIYKNVDKTDSVVIMVQTPKIKILTKFGLRMKQVGLIKMYLNR